jgi:hypothetical protein
VVAIFIEQQAGRLHIQAPSVMNMASLSSGRMAIPFSHAKDKNGLLYGKIPCG